MTDTDFSHQQSALGILLGNVPAGWHVTQVRRDGDVGVVVYADALDAICVRVDKDGGVRWEAFVIHSCTWVERGFDLVASITASRRGGVASDVEAGKLFGLTRQWQSTLTERAVLDSAHSAGEALARACLKSVDHPEFRETPAEMRDSAEMALDDAITNLQGELNEGLPAGELGEHAIDAFIGGFWDAWDREQLRGAQL
jgi:hypothetical protein